MDLYHDLDHLTVLIQTRQTLLVNLAHFVVLNETDEDPESRHLIPLAMEQNGSGDKIHSLNISNGFIISGVCNKNISECVLQHLGCFQVANCGGFASPRGKEGQRLVGKLEGARNVSVNLQGVLAAEVVGQINSVVGFPDICRVEMLLPVLASTIAHTAKIINSFVAWHLLVLCIPRGRWLWRGSRALRRSTRICSDLGWLVLKIDINQQFTIGPGVLEQLGVHQGEGLIVVIA